MPNPHVVFTALGVIFTLAVFVRASRAQEDTDPAKPLKMLRKIYLSVHSSLGGSLDHPLGELDDRLYRVLEQWPARTEIELPR